MATRIIAALAALVVTFFMHLFWDKKFHLILFLTSVLFLILFLSMATTDRGEYDKDVEAFRAAQAQLSVERALHRAKLFSGDREFNRLLQHVARGAGG